MPRFSLFLFSFNYLVNGVYWSWCREMRQTCLRNKLFLRKKIYGWHIYNL